MPSLPSPAGRPAGFQAASARATLPAFLLSGLLYALPGTLLPLWRHHLDEAAGIIGFYFLFVGLGVLSAHPVSHYLMRGLGLRARMAVASGVACASLIYFAALLPGASPWFRMVGMFGIGLGATLLNTGLFEGLTSVYRANPTATLYLSGTLFGLGSALTALLVAGIFYIYTVPSILILLATLPGFGIGLFARSRLRAEPHPDAPSFRQAVQDFRRPAAVLLALLLFFQFGNEWAIAGWLPLYLIRTVGASPEGSLLLLGVYWVALVIGRVLMVSLVPSVNAVKLMGAGLLSALFGCMVLLNTDNRFGATMGLLLVGGGYAPLYPLLVEKIGNRFPYYHPGFFNGIFSFGILGGMLAPSSLGLFVAWWGVRTVMLLPLAGTIMAFALLTLVWAEARFAESTRPPL